MIESQLQSQANHVHVSSVDDVMSLVVGIVARWLVSYVCISLGISCLRETLIHLAIKQKKDTIIGSTPQKMLQIKASDDSYCRIARLASCSMSPKVSVMCSNKEKQN